MHRFYPVVLLSAVITGAQAASVSTDYLDLELTGGMSGGYFYSAAMYDPANILPASSSTSSGSLTPAETLTKDRDNFLLNDVLLELSTEKTTPIGADIKLGFGNLKMVTILDGNGNWALNQRYDRSGQPLPTTGTNLTRSELEQNVNELAAQNNNNDFRVYYGFVSVEAFDNVAIEIGKLATNLGYEVAPSYANWNITLGAVWRGQPNYYNGVRVVYDIDLASLYGEFNDDSNLGDGSAWSIGAYGSQNLLRYGAAYFDGTDGRNLFDAMVEARFPRVIVAGNFNFYSLDTIPVGQTDKTGYAFSILAVPHLDKIFVPVRMEFIREGNTNVWGVEGAYTLTVTPTYYLSGNAYVRAEYSRVSSRNYVFREHGPLPQLESYAKSSFIVQAGYHF